MKYTKTIFSVIFFALLTFNLPAQKEKNDKKDTTEEASGGGVDKALEDGLNKIGSFFKKKNKKKVEENEVEEAEERTYEDEPTPENQNEYGDDKSLEEYQDYTVPQSDVVDEPFVPNEFICSFINKMTFYKNGKEKEKDRMEIHVVLDREKTAMKMIANNDGNTSLMVLDNKNRTMITIPDVNGTDGMKMKQRNMKKMVEKATSKMTITPTDDYKTIDGRRCRKYLVEDPEYNSIVWVAQDIDLNYSQMLGSMFASSGKKSQSAGGFSDLKGVPLETHATSKNGKEEYHSVIQDLQIGKIDRTIFDLSKYNITTLPFFGN